MATAIAGAIIGGLGGAAVVGVVGSALIHIGVGVAFSAVSAALMKQDTGATKVPGIRSQVTTEGDTSPQTFIVGYYATPGNLVCPHMSHNKNSSGGVPSGGAGSGSGNYRTQVRDLGDKPITALHQIIIEGLTFDWDSDFDHSSAGLYGSPVDSSDDVLSDYNGHLWVKFYDGNQTVADPYLLGVYGDHEERPWSADMVGTGVPYVILTFKLNRELWSSEPINVRFVVDGIELTDPRDPDVSEFSANAATIVWNIFRGITMPDGLVYGLKVDPEDLPTADWSNAVNKCDPDLDAQGGYRAGFEVRIANPDIGGDDPLSVADEVLKVCDGDVADVGGVWHVRVGAPDLPLAIFTDRDFVRGDGQSFTPFRGLSETFNGVHATYPSPDDLWNPRDAPPRYAAAAELDDGERLIADLNLSACPFPDQVQRLMAAWLADARRFRVHDVPVSSKVMDLDPLKAVSWSSDRWGYFDKTFEIARVVEHPLTLSHRVTLRERDPSDYSPAILIPVDVVSTDPVRGPALEVAGFNAVGVVLTDDDDVARRPVCQIVWDTVEIPDVIGLIFEVVRAGTGELIARETVLDTALGVHVISAVLLPDVEYQARAKWWSNGTSNWTPYVSFTSADVRVSVADLDQGVIDLFDAAAASADAAVSAAQDFADDAAEWADQAAGAVIAAAFHASAADGSASQASNSATTASGSEAAAGQSATAAADSASAASSSADDAGQSASAAQSSRVAAETAETGSQSGASAAAGSASAASASETAAGQSATAAGQSESAASTSAGTASVKASEAATSASEAGSSATQAATSAEVSANASASAVTGNLVRSPRGGMAGDGWISNAADSSIIPPNADVGTMSLSLNDASREHPQYGGDVSGRSFRVTGWVNTQSISNPIKFGLRGKGVDSGSLESNWLNTDVSIQVAAGLDWHYIDGTFTVTEASLTWSAGMDTVSGTTGNALVYDLHYEDVTESLAALAAASASAASASAASASETAAGQSATAANSAKTDAETASGSASTSATQAASSATDAEGFKNSAVIAQEATAKSTELAKQFSVGNLVGDPNFIYGTDFFVTSSGGQLSDVVHGQPEPSSDKALRFEDDDAVAGFYSLPYLPGNYNGKTFRATFMARSNSGSRNLVWQVRGLKDGSWINSEAAFATVETTFESFELVVQYDPVDTDEVRFRFYYNGAVADDWMEIADLKIQEITDFSEATATANLALTATVDEDTQTAQARIGATVDGVTGEVIMTAVLKADGTPATDVKIKSDTFVFEGDLAAFLGDVKITGDLIVDGASTRTAHQSAWSTQILDFATVPEKRIIFPLDCDFEDYQGSTINPDNPVCTTVSFELVPKTNLSGRVRINVQSWDESAGTYSDSFSFQNKKFYSWPSGMLDKRITVTFLFIDGGAGLSIPLVNEAVVVAKIEDAASNCAIQSVGVKMEQLNR